MKSGVSIEKNRKIEDVDPSFWDSNLEMLEATLERLEAARSLSFLDWCMRITPLVDGVPHYDWNLRHTRYIASVLDRVERGELQNVIINMPPQHGKSLTITEHWTAYMLWKYPRKRGIVCSYNESLAVRFGRNIKRNFLAAGGVLAEDQQAVASWATSAHGGLLSVGVGGGVTGNPGDFLVYDDPIKGRAEAESKLIRDKTWDHYVDELSSRLPMYAPRILVTTRWHEDDIAARMLEQDKERGWVVVNIPAIAGVNDPLGRAVGEALYPERFDTKYLEMQRAMNPRTFEALYQGNPTPREGSMFKVGRVQVVDALPERYTNADGNDVPFTGKWVRYWDKAGTDGGDGAETAGVLMMRGADGLFYIGDIVHGRWSAHEREQTIYNTATKDGKACKIRIEQEPGSGGKESAEATVRRLAGWNCTVDRVTGSKELRAENYSVQVDAGNVRLVRGAWNDEYIEQLRTFPNGKLKDMVDASSGAFNMIVEGDNKGGGFKVW